MTGVLGFLDTEKLLSIVLSVIPALLCITFHELSHGFVALKLGDTTARDMGRLTLNPIKHIDIFGLVMMVAFGFGWAKPVPVDMRNFKNPKRGMAVTALAGPVSNILLAAVFFALYGVAAAFAPASSGSAFDVILQMVARTAMLSVALAVFNIIPIPPLDGSKVLFALLPDRAYSKLMRVERYGFIILMVVIYTNILDSTIGAATMWTADRLSPITHWVYTLLTKLTGRF
ncbi:MAG: site-2 protease family protein [Oscillospiraceae bacterium]|jgi:Zn-dependent protease|nr:site-2 protease family protein [Oscillospiraceae bacterium]